MGPHIRAETDPLARLRQILLIAMGWTIVALGLVLMPLPGPFGVPLVVVGGLLLLRNSALARRRLIRWKRSASPRLAFLVRRLEGWRDRRRMKRRG